MRNQGYNEDGELIRDVYVNHEPVDLECDPSEGLTRQEFAKDCDINTLMATYERTGHIVWLNKGEPQYYDASDVPDLRSALDAVAAAEAAFMRLPARVRKEFDNDPVAFVQFAEDPKNIDKMREWGLAPPKPSDRVVEPPGRSPSGSAAPASSSAPASAPSAAAPGAAAAESAKPA